MIQTFKKHHVPLYKAPAGSLSHTATSNSRWSSLFRRSQGLQSLVERNNTRSECLRDRPYRPSVIIQTAGGNRNGCVTFHSTYSIKNAVWVTANRGSEKQSHIGTEWCVPLVSCLILQEAALHTDIFPWNTEDEMGNIISEYLLQKTQQRRSNRTHNYHTWLSQQGVRPRPPAAKQLWYLTITNALHVMNQ